MVNLKLNNVMYSRRIIKSKYNFCNLRHIEGDIPVKEGMSLTPYQMLAMNQQGIPISANMLPDDMFDDGSPEPADHFTLDQRRGVDINDLWQQNMSFKTKWKKFKSSQEVNNSNPLNNNPKGGE